AGTSVKIFVSTIRVVRCSGLRLACRQSALGKQVYAPRQALPQRERNVLRIGEHTMVRFGPGTALPTISVARKSNPSKKRTYRSHLRDVIFGVGHDERISTA